jgi:zinc transport system ATP-binding protein
MPKDPLLSVENVSFRYNGLQVIQDVSFDVYPGDFLALIGPNGSGKTTLIRIILGILKPTRGRVVFMGEEMGRFSQWQRVGYVPQKATHRDPHFPASVRELVEIKDLKGRRIGELSGGQQQRAFIARAIVNRPNALFLDEPTAGVDGETQARFYDMLAGLNQREGLTIVLITHDIGVITKHVDKVACLNQRLFFHGSHEEFCSSSMVQELLQGEHHLVCHRH